MRLTRACTPAANYCGGWDLRQPILKVFPSSSEDKNFIQLQSKL